MPRFEGQKINNLVRKELPKAVEEIKEVKEKKELGKEKAVKSCVKGKWAKNLSLKGFGFPEDSKEDKKMRKHLCSELTELV